MKECEVTDVQIAVEVFHENYIFEEFKLVARDKVVDIRIAVKGRRGTPQ